MAGKGHDWKGRVVLAVVLMVTIIAIALLGGFVSFAPSKGAQDSQLYWQGATPFSIKETQMSTANVTP